MHLYTSRELWHCMQKKAAGHAVYASSCGCCDELTEQCPRPWACVVGVLAAMDKDWCCDEKSARPQLTWAARIVLAKQGCSCRQR